MVIIGSGFSAFTTYLKLKKYNPIIITSTNKELKNLNIPTRENLITNKVFSKKSLSKGNIKFKLKKNTKLHDRLCVGGNSNIWGGFINISKINSEVLEQFKNLGIQLRKLDQDSNGYSSNNRDIRQLRDSNDKILDTANYLNNCIEGFVKSIELKNNLIKITFFSNKNNNLESLTASKLFLAISFPQLIDLLYRSNLFDINANLQLSEFDHEFIFNTNKIITNKSKNNLIIKYDFVRSFKHFFGVQRSIDKFQIKIPAYIDQIFSNNKILLDLKFNINNKTLDQTSFKRFGSSIHYCNLYVNTKTISEYLSFFSNNIYGVSTPFINQNKPGPISNDIINNIWNNF